MAGIEDRVLETLVAKSVEVKGKAYARYSKFPVGAALLTDTGDIFTGTYMNVTCTSSRLDAAAGGTVPTVVPSQWTVPPSAIYIVYRAA